MKNENKKINIEVNLQSKDIMSFCIHNNNYSFNSLFFFSIKF